VGLIDLARGQDLEQNVGNNINENGQSRS